MAKRITLFVAALTAAVSILPAGNALAANYSVYSCAGPSGETLPNSAWLSSVVNAAQTPYFTFGTACGGLSVSALPAISYVDGDGGERVFNPPPGTTISGYRIVRSARVEFGAAATKPQVSTGIRETTGSVFADRDCSGVVADCFVNSGVAQASGLALTELAVGIHCVDSLGCQPAGWSELTTTLESARVDVDDSTAPVTTAFTGTLPGSDAPAGVRTVQATTTDVGGGVERVELIIDGVTVQAVGAGGSCIAPFTARQPCPSGLVADFSVDTGPFTNGLHIGNLRAVDAAGNASTDEAFLFTVSGGGTNPAPPPPVNGIPAVEKPTLTARAGSTSVTGTLTYGATPIAGAHLEVGSLDIGVYGSKPVALGDVTTDAAGRFTIPFRPRGAQRVTVSFRPASGAAITASAQVTTRQSLRLSIKRSKSKVKPRGKLTLSGRLSGAGAAADGAPVEIDAIVDGEWRAVGVVEAGRIGGYRWTYRFSRVKQPTVFTFRAVVRKNKSWPWATERSKQVKVLVSK
jgi:hypothetical protein